MLIALAREWSKWQALLQEQARKRKAKRARNRKERMKVARLAQALTVLDATLSYLLSLSDLNASNERHAVWCMHESAYFRPERYNRETMALDTHGVKRMSRRKR